jgi:siroheme synthase (precorrin-2 oxidase/ferrochelatase)
MPTQMAKDSSVKERKKILIVGAGSIGERHIRCFLATERAEVQFVEPRD